MSPPKGALAGIDGPDGNKAQPATPLGLGHDCCRRNIKHGSVFLGSQLTRRQQSGHGDTDVLGLPDQTSDERFHGANPL
jgi:hypothetical protein